MQVQQASDTPAADKKVADTSAGGTGQEPVTAEETLALEGALVLVTPEADEVVPSREDAYDFSKKSQKSSALEPQVEVGALVPVPVPVSTSNDCIKEEGGEARSQMQGDGGDNSQGTGQWKSEERAYMESSLLKQHAEQEALLAVINEKVKLQRKFDELKIRYIALEEGSRKWEEECNMLMEKCQKSEAHIKELEAVETRLREYESWGKDNKAKINNLQGHLAILAGEDAEKDRQIHKLQEDLHDANSRLINAERQAAVSAQAMHRETPKSNTCVVM